MPPLEQMPTVVGILLGCWLAKAVILRAAIGLMNGMIRNEDAAAKIRTPSFGWSMIVAAVIFVPWLGTYSLVWPATDPVPRNAYLISIAIGTPISLLITGGILCLMLAIPFRRGVGAAFCMTVMLGSLFAVALVATQAIAS